MAQETSSAARERRGCLNVERGGDVQSGFGRSTTTTTTTPSLSHSPLSSTLASPLSRTRLPGALITPRTSHSHEITPVTSIPVATSRTSYHAQHTFTHLHITPHLNTCSHFVTLTGRTLTGGRWRAPSGVSFPTDLSRTPQAFPLLSWVMETSRNLFVASTG